MVSRKASAPKRAVATQKLTKKSAAATAKKVESAAKAKKAAKTKKKASNAIAKVSSTNDSSADKQQRADATALATTSGGGAGGAGGSEKHSDRGKVLYVGHLPHGFYEEQLRGYFSQFGAVTRVRLSRVKKTGKPKSYAFLEFANPAVASIAAGAMDGYLMFSQRLSVRVMSPETVHPSLFKGANRTFTKVPWKEIERKRVNKKLSPEEARRRRARAAKRDGERAARIKASGIDYEYEKIVDDFVGEEKKEKKKAMSSSSSSRSKKAKAEEEKVSEPAKRAKTATTTTTKAAPAAPKAAVKKAAAATAAPAAAPKKVAKRGTSAAAAPARSSKRARG